MIIDSPGFVINTIQNDFNLPKNSFKIQLKPKTFQMKKGETLQLENIYLNFDNDTSITIYMINDLKVKKVFKEIDFDYNILVENNNDLIISGLGFINIKKQSNIKISNLKEELIEVRESVFGGLSE